MEVVELETKLAADEAGVLRDELVASLAGKRVAVRQRIDAGLTPEEFRLAQDLYDACAAAEKVVVDFWQEAHSSRAGGRATRIL